MNIGKNARKLLSLFIVLLLIVISMSSCFSRNVIDIGYSGMLVGELPNVYFGIQSEKNEFDLDNVKLEVSFGNGATSDVGGTVGEEESPVMCVALYICNSAYLDNVVGFGDARFKDYTDIEGLYFVRDISLDDYNENYDVETGFMRRKYDHTEILHMPREVFEKREGYVCIVVAEIIYERSTNSYFMGYCGCQGLKYEVIGDSVILNEPGSTVYADPIE